MSELQLQINKTIVPKDWWKSTVALWADKQTNKDTIQQANATLAAIEAAWRKLGLNTVELMKARRYLEIRWGELLGPGKSGPQKSSHASEDLDKDDRHRFRVLARYKSTLLEHLDKTRIEEDLTRAALLRAARIQRKKPEPEKVITPGFPDGPFHTIVIDPPWPIKKIVLERRPVEKTTIDYATISLEEIAKLPIKRLANQNGTHVYLWVTHKYLPASLELFTAWGVRYECVLTWIKPTAQPLHWRYLTEHILFGKVGALPLLKKGEAVCFEAPQQRHSHKPEEFFDLVRLVSPKPRLTMFDGPREGFVSWGISHAN